MTLEGRWKIYEAVWSKESGKHVGKSKQIMMS